MGRFRFGSGYGLFPNFQFRFFKKQAIPVRVTGSRVPDSNTRRYELRRQTELVVVAAEKTMASEVDEFGHNFLNGLGRRRIWLKRYFEQPRKETDLALNDI